MPDITLWVRENVRYRFSESFVCVRKCDRSDTARVTEHISKIIQYSCASVSLTAAGGSLCQPVAAKVKLSGCLVSKDIDSANFCKIGTQAHSHSDTQEH